MSEMEIKGEQFYFIPLDSLDLVYLGKYLHTPRAEKMPLWTKKTLNGESEYCQVQIVRAHDNKECYSEKTIEMTDCHICSVEVPITCYKEHTESERHVTLENIFQNILERLSKQIKITIIHNDNSIDKDLLYHCVSCSKIIKIENKQKHEMSPYHLKSQKELSIVQEFYKMLKKENLVNSNYFEEVNEVTVDEESESEKIISTEHLQINTIRNCVSESVQDMHSNDDTNTVCSSNDHTTKLTSDDNLVSSSFEEYYFKQIIRKHDLKVDLPIIDGDFIHITNSRGIKVKIFKDIFHSFTSRSQSVYCQLCDSLFTPEEKNEHKGTGRHARNIFIQVNEHFARMFCNNFWSHCLICNEVYQTSYLSKHCLVDENHIRTLRSSKISDVCQNNVDTNTATVNNTEVTRSGISESGERRMVEYIEENKEQTKSEKLTNEKDLYKSKENKLKCSDDKEYIGGINMSEDRRDDHMGDKNHTEKTKEVPPVQKVVFCELCNVTVLQDQIEYHNAGTTHWSNALKKIFTSVALGLQAYLSEDETKSNDTSEKSKDDTKAEHDEAKVDENPSKNNIKINNENSITNGENTITEDETTITQNKTAKPDDKNTITKHNAINNENPISEDENGITEDENTITDDKNVTKHDGLTSTSISNGLIAPPNPFRFADFTKTKLTCVVCDIDIDNTQQSIDAHKNSSKHEISLKDLLSFHSIKKSYNYFSYKINYKLNAEVSFCGFCNINVTDIWEHIKTQKHTALLQLEFEMSTESMKTFVYKCKGRYSEASKFREHYKMLLITNRVVQFPYWHYCLLCKLKLSGEGSEIDHMLLSKKHKTKLANIFKSRQRMLSI